MNTLVIYKSVHHGNTKKIARAISQVLSSPLTTPEKLKTSSLKDFDLIGFGSGIYFGRFHKKISNLVEKLPFFKGKKAFLFATSGAINGILQPPDFDFFKAVEKKLLKKGFLIVGKFDCLGWDSYVLKSLGGINKGRPNKKDLAKAREFAKSLTK